MVFGTFYGVVVAGQLANINCIFHLNITLVFLSYHPVVLFGEIASNISSYSLVNSSALVQSPCGAPVSVSKTSLRAFSHLRDIQQLEDDMQLVCFNGTLQIINQFTSVDAVEGFTHNQCTNLFFVVIVLSIINLEVKVCSIFDQFGLEAACNGGISAWSLSLILLMLQATKILWRQERRIISLKFNDGPFTLLGF